MLSIRNQVPLAEYNTFGISEQAERLVEVQTDAELLEALALAKTQGWALTLLGGGSNVVISSALSGLVVVMRSRGRRVLQRGQGWALIEGEAGENWHALVNWTLDMGLSGLENLSLIPGTLGAAPVQNIGAYGVELVDVFDSLDALDCETGQICQFSREDCQFAYRESLFKASAGRYIILRVRLRLDTRPSLRVSYAPLAAAWAATGLLQPDPRVVSELVCALRRSKLPDPRQLGNAGSFFKNPVVSSQQLGDLLARWPGMPWYPQADGSAKLAAGWLIDQAGWRGFRAGAVGVHSEQALVLVNFGAARGGDILELAQRIADDVRARFGVELDMEPRVLR